MDKYSNGMVVVWSSSAKQDLAYVLDDVEGKFGCNVAKNVKNDCFLM